MSFARVLPLASSGPLGGVICLLGLLGAAAWFGWRFGPTVLRFVGIGSWWVAWACGSQGGYGYCVALALLGLLAWVAGTLWYARRRGRWPSATSACLLGLLVGARGERRRETRRIASR